MTTSDAQGDLTSNPHKFTHTSNGILDQKSLDGRTIGEVTVLHSPTKPKIILTPHTLLTPAAKEIFASVTSGNAWTSRTSRRISRTGVDISIPASTHMDSGMIKFSTPASSDSTETRGTGTRIYIGATDPPCGLNAILEIDDIQQLLPHIWESPINRTLLLIKNSPIIWLRRPFSLK